MKTLFILTFFNLLFLTFAIELKTPNVTWDMLSEFALGVWKYANTTMIMPTIPHT